MQLCRKEPPVDYKALIASKLSEYDIMVMYIGSLFKLHVAFRSPLHQDKGKPSFSVGVSRSGHLHWKDYSLDESGGWSDLVARMYGLTYPEVLQKVCKDFGLLEGKDNHQKIISAYKQPVIEENYRTLIQCTVREGYLKRDIEYWGKYLITEEDLLKEKIYSVSELYINRQRILINPNEKVYAYRYPDETYKIYMPDRPKGEKWKMNVSNTHIENLENLNGDPKVLITKSKKDRICLQSIVPYPVLNVQNEGSAGYTEEFRNRLMGKEVIICYDADDAGVRNCKKICDQWGYSYVNTPRHLLKDDIKDPSDWIRAIGNREPLQEFLTNKGII